ncbi:MAG: PEP-CTERM sorting domain-containing protein [Candidatus Omnitrophota bacterium]
MPTGNREKKVLAAIFRYLVVIGAIILFAGNSFADSSYQLNGDLSDWGVTPFTNWTPTSSSVDYVVQDNTNNTWSDPFNEVYDIEAVYFDDRGDSIYFAVVSSNSYSYGWAHESIFLDFSGKTSNDLLKTGKYTYALDLCPLPINALSTKGVYRTNTVWTTAAHYNGSPYTFPITVANGSYVNGVWTYYYDDTLLGTYEVYNKCVGSIEPGVTGDTYILEGRIDKSLFPELEDAEYGTAYETYVSKVTCVKDWVSVRGSIDSVPEPSTFLLLGFGLAGAAVRRIRRR